MVILGQFTFVICSAIYNLIFVFWIANRSLGDIIDFDQELIPVNHEAKLKTSIH